MNIFREVSQSGSDGGIFRNEDALMPNYLPDSVLHRQREISEIAYALRNIPKGKKPENMLLTGPTGTGKTTCARHVLRELSDYTQRAVPIYVNCWEYSTRFSILNLVVTKLGEILPRRGIAVDEIVDRISQICKLENKVPVLVLDEIDRLLISAHGEEKLLYDIARSSENFGVNFGLIGITNNESFQSLLDPRVKSSLSFVHMKVDRYSPSQLKDILRARADIAFSPSSIDSEVVPVCAAMGAKYGGDARVSITTPWKAGRHAEKSGAR
ncbi:MAG TPA: AAA family ATPase, partial [Candidatus Micrarchaeota archaeon]|nr:AAA family ATPase [Candidatus Micrarchaeota archaeon]